MSEKELMDMLNDSRTQREGFSALVAQYSEQLYWKVRHIVIYHDDANDVLQNTFIKAWKNLDTFQGKSTLSTWLYRIAINEALDFIRKQKMTAKASSEEIKNVVSKLKADEYFDGNQMQALLQQAVAMLPEVQRTVFTMKYFQEMKYSEISKILQTTEGALKASYHLAVKKITEYFKNND